MLSEVFEISLSLIFIEIQGKRLSLFEHMLIIQAKNLQAGCTLHCKYSFFLRKYIPKTGLGNRGSLTSNLGSQTSTRLTHMKKSWSLIFILSSLFLPVLVCCILYRGLDNKYINSCSVSCRLKADYLLLTAFIKFGDFLVSRWF